MIDLECPGRDLNPHALVGARDFKSVDRFFKNNNVLIYKGFYRSFSDLLRHRVRTKVRTLQKDEIAAKMIANQ